MGHLKGRKVRNLDNGRFYVSKNQAASAEIRSRKRLENFDCDAMMRCSLANQTNHAIAKRVKGFKKFLEKNPDFMSEKAKRMYKEKPYLKKMRSDFLKRYHDILGLASTDPEVAEYLSYVLKHCRNGREVVRYIECEREKSVGVTTYTDDDYSY